ncbi:hypothetical protein BD560DRAFT_19693 [Blakeslea trispora]|nr:hypothetical protein BD560DRAFT_19693 [Blakeslea trispora]
MHYLGAKELYSFLTDKSLDDLFLQAFISKNEMLIISTSSQSSWEQLRNTWTRRYKELWKEARKNEKMKRCMVEVEEDMWKLLYSSTNVQNNLESRLFRWCEKKFKEEQEDEVESESIPAEVFLLEEKADKSLTEQLQIMSCKLIMTFDTLTGLQKNVLKLSVSNIINFNCTQYSDEYARYLSLAQYKKLAELKAPRIISQEEEELKRYFKDAKQAVFEKDEGVQISVSKGAKQQIAYICTMM